MELPEEPPAPQPTAVPEPGPMSPKAKQGSLFVHYGRSTDYCSWLPTTRIRLPTVAPMAEDDMPTPTPNHVAQFDHSNRANLNTLSSQRSTFLASLVPPALGSGIDASAFESNLTDDSSPEPSPLFTPADSECEIDIFELDADVLDIALHMQIGEVEAKELYRDRVARAGLVPQV